MADTVALMRKRVLDMAFEGSLTTPLSSQLGGNYMSMKNTGTNQNNVPYTIPDSWKWVQLKEVATLLNGRAYKKHELLESGKTPVLRVGNFFTNNHWYYSNLELDENKYCEEGDLLYAWSASFGPKIWDGPKAIYHYHIWKIEYLDLVEREFLYYWFLKDVNDIKSITTGSTMIHVTKGNMEKRLFPLPPVAEQKRIVAKVEEIFAVIDQIGTRKEEALSIISNMRHTALQDAIMGVLVEQNETDETASELYEKINNEKEILVKSGKIKRNKPLPKIKVEEIPFEIPQSWKWVRMGELGFFKKGPFGSALTKSIFVEESPSSIKVYEQKNAIQSDWNLGDYFIKNDYYKDKMLSNTVNPGDIIISCAGTIGKSYIIPEEASIGIINQALMRVRVYTINKEYFRLIFNYVIQTDVAKGKGSAIQNIPPMKILNNLVVPLPPLAEQERIVAKLGEITAICNQMEAILNGSSEISDFLKVV